MNRSKISIGVLIIVLIILASFWIWQKIQRQGAVVSECKNKQHQVATKLQSGEQGIVSITGNACQWPQLIKDHDLTFFVSPEGAITNNFDSIKLIAWSRDQQPIEHQIAQVFHQRNQNDCKVEKSQQYELSQYILEASMNTEQSLNLCSYYPPSDLYSEYFFEANGLLVFARIEGSYGLQPFDQSSIKFLRS